MVSLHLFSQEAFILFILFFRILLVENIKCPNSSDDICLCLYPFFLWSTTATCFRQFRGLSRLQRGPGPLRHRQDGRHQEEVREPRPHLHQPAQAGCHIDPSFLFYYIVVISFYLAKISPSLISFELYGIFIPTLNVIGIIL